MSDRGFGDHPSKNVMKNPLLSTAVIGVSLDDLTHNAVLLPAVPSQELITRQDEQTGSQERSLGYSEQKTSDFSSGDANANHMRTQMLSNVTNTQPLDSSIRGNDRNTELNKTVVSNAPGNADDDFDVNEYFARLQGTRYVSAPLNSANKEDIGAESEENLEEINLNEPDKPIADEVQHSLTADIAQNFSQLPTVLPQVASAVFSSFSNMLSMKSREHTPDEGRPQPEYQTQPEEIGVPLMGVTDVAKDVAPPPKEPPTIGTASNYRITTRKKMYAPIPGLRSGDMSQSVPVANPPMGWTNTPSFFTPEATGAVDINSNLATATAQPDTDYNIHEGPPMFDSRFQDNIASNVAVETNQNTLQQFSHSVNLDSETAPPNIYDETKPLIEDNNLTDSANMQSIGAMLKSNPMDYFQPHITQKISADPPQPVAPANASNISVIPPPPMFTNLPKSEGQNSLRSVLPPSIARRISASNPVIKTQAPPSFAPVHNIFVPSSNISTQPLLEENMPHGETNPTIASMPRQFLDTPLIDKTSKVELQQFTSPNNSYAPPSSLLPTTYQTTKAPGPAPALREILLTGHPEKDVVPKLPFNITQPSDLSVTHLSQLNLEPPITNLAEELTCETPKMPPITAMSLKNLNKFQFEAISDPPPMFINPNFVKACNVKPNQDAKPVEFKESNAPESAKTISEPPKMSTTQNFRMTKKRPQYYSGPIEGVGNISNNVKPTINPAPTNTFQSTVYTPQFPSESTPAISGISLPQVGQTPEIPPFDITRPSADNSAAATPYPEYIINQPEIISNVQPDYNTAFDLSRKTTEYFDRPQQESKGFGIIGSLKSKLGSIDINKIQNTVTTFFDPAYNYTKMDASAKQGDVAYDAINQSVSGLFNQLTTNENNLEIYVPGAEPTSHVGYNYQMVENNTDQIASDNVYYRPSNNTYSYFGNQTDNAYAPNTYSYEANNNKFVSKINSPPSEYTFTISGNVHNVPKGLEAKTATTYKSDYKEESTEVGPAQNINNPLMSSNTIANCQTHQQAHSFFDNSFQPEFQSYVGTDHKSYPLMAPENVKGKDVIQTGSIPSEPATDDSADKLNLNDLIATKPEDLVKSIIEEKDEFISHDTKEKNIADLENSAIKYFVQTTESSNLTMFSKPIFDSTDQVTNIANPMKNINLFEKSQNQEVSYFDHSAASFFATTVTSSTETSIKLNDEQENENNDLNICETCREVNKPEEKELENLTDQLIENITAPIQLSNPVEAPLSEGNASDVNETSFENDQCAAITHITEETIETIHVQAATELLDDSADKSTVIRNYGWSTEDMPLTSSNVLLEHDYTYQQPDGGSNGFFQNKSLFFDNMPTNASDEIKAEYKNSLDDAIPLVPRQLSVPSAPPAEDDTKSDESGLDVHSIEQDAKKDFPIFEDYVVDPSETDDDKIEFREREKSDDPAHDVDTFTNRVERYKKMEETHADQVDDVFEAHKIPKSFKLPTSTTPPMTIASYFDTGNYAVENHYRNSLTLSPSNLNNIQSIAQSSLMRVPPGFEDEFQRRLSLVSNEGFLTTDKDEFTKYIQHPQSNLSTALTASQLSIDPRNFLSQETEDVIKQPSEKSRSESIDNLHETLPHTDVKLPNFASIFGGMSGGQHEENQTVSPLHPQVTPESILERTNPLQSATDTSATDPIYFQSAAPVTTESSDVYDFTRLSSYFSTTTQADPSKSFFELSQSQDHYRQETTKPKDILGVDCDSSALGNTGLSSSNKTNLNDKLNIPHETYVANMNLMKDLTSPTNIDFIPKEQTVRSVNFFTVVYDDDTLNPVTFKKGESKNLTEKTSSNIILEKSNSVLKKQVETDPKSQHCCNTDADLDSDINIKNLDNLDSSKVKFREHMNGNSSDANNDSDIMEKKKEDGGRSVTVNFDPCIQEEKEDSVAITTENRSYGEYSPVKHHWFYRVDQEDKPLWKGFSIVDSTALENAYNSPDLDDKTIVATDGGRYDVHVVGRLRVPVYWSEKPTNVLRCSWFYRGNSEARYVPYPESVALKLEEEYRHGIRTGEWHRRLSLPDGEMVVMHGPSVMVHFLQGSATDAFSSSPRFIFTKWVHRAPLNIKFPQDEVEELDHLLLILHGAGHPGYGQTTMRPRVVRRGCEESEIEESEPSQVDHLLLLCHGVGSACDMRFRPVEEVVDDFRATSLQLLQSHYKNSYESGIVGRIEVLPVSWHSALHSGESGVDRRLAQVTLDSIPRLRNFTNDTVLDVLFYTSPVYCQTIIDTVCKELNRIYSIFKTRNPTFNGGVSLGGHSLGSVILYDLLCHQTPEENSSPGKRYVTGSAGTGQPSVKYPQLQFNPDVLYALGSPIAIFECIRGVEQLGPDFCLPTCKKFFNIFHPYDPIAYRIEPLINPQLKNVKPLQIPHHKGRKRMHLELKDTMARVGADLKQKLIESIRSTWSSIWKTQPPNDQHLEKVVEEEMEKEQLTDETKEETFNDDEATPEMLGRLNGGRRVDHVLQEAPFEMINEYLFAMSSHVCYWESEDTMLLVLREAYGGRGVRADGGRPQASLSVPRPRADDFKIIGSDYPSTSHDAY